MSLPITYQEVEYIESTGTFIKGRDIFSTFASNRLYLGNTRVKLIVPEYVEPTPSQQVIYGVKLDYTLDNGAPNGNTWATYTDDAVGFSGAYMDFANDTFVDNGWYNRFPFNQMKPCLVKNGAVVGYLDPNDYTKFADGTASHNDDLTSGDVMIEIPKIYYKLSTDNQYNYIQISDKTFTGACCLAHVYQGQELSKIYVDAYLTPGSDFATIGPRSVKGITVAPQGTTVGYQKIYPYMKQYRGNRVESLNFNIFTLLGCLFAIMFKSTNAINKLGKGLTQRSNGMTTGDLDNKGLCYGQNTSNTTTTRLKLFGLEDYFGTQYTYCVGFYIDYTSHKYKIIDPYDANLTYSYAESMVQSYPEWSTLSSDLQATLSSTAYVPVKLSGINALGFTRIEETGTNVSTTTSVGLTCNTRFRNTNKYYCGCISSYWGSGAGVYNFDSYNFADSSRRAFRCVYFPEENNN